MEFNFELPPVTNDICSSCGMFVPNSHHYGCKNIDNTCDRFFVSDIGKKVEEIILSELKSTIKSELDHIYSEESRIPQNFIYPTKRDLFRVYSKLDIHTVRTKLENEIGDCSDISWLNCKYIFKNVKYILRKRIISGMWTFFTYTRLYQITRYGRRDYNPEENA